MQRQFNALQKAQLKLEAAIEAMEDILREKIEFDFSVQFQPSDGFTILEIDNSRNTASLKSCMNIIRKKGKLSVEDFLEITV